MSAERIIPARAAEQKRIEAFPYFTAHFSPPIDPAEEEDETPVASGLSSPEEDAQRLASVDQVIFDKLQMAENEAQDIARHAYEEGFAAGEAEGRSFGESQYRAFMQRMEAHFSELAESATLLRKASEDELLALTLAMAEYLAGQQLEQSEQAIRPLLQRLLEQHPFPGQTGEGAALVVHMNPKDLEQVAETYIARPGLQLAEDPELSRGSLRVESPEGVLEATLERRRERLLQLLHGQHQAERP